METILLSDLKYVFHVLLKSEVRSNFTRSNLNLLKSVAKLLKSSKLMEQLQCSRWSDTADFLTFLRRFLVRLETPMCSIAQF